MIRGGPDGAGRPCAEAAGETEGGGTGTLVVGVDGSETSVEALRFALAEARLRSAGVRAVCAWEVPPAAYGDGTAPTIEETEAYERAAERAVEGALAAAGAADAGVPVETCIVHDWPGETLVRESEGAELLVVGSRGLGGIRSLVLGSVSQECCHRAPCPVVVIPAHRQ